YELLEGLEPDLHVLEERDFVRRRHGSAIEGEREYAIKHAVTREVAYASIPKAKRAHLHAAFAAWLERFGGGRDEHAPLLAHHFAEAARPEDADLAWAGEEAELERLRGQAVEWLRRSADLAVARYDIDEGLAYLARAVELSGDAAQQSEIWRARSPTAGRHRPTARPRGRDMPIPRRCRTAPPRGRPSAATIRRLARAGVRVRPPRRPRRDRRPRAAPLRRSDGRAAARARPGRRRSARARPRTRRGGGRASPSGCSRTQPRASPRA